MLPILSGLHWHCFLPALELFNIQEDLKNQEFYWVSTSKSALQKGVAWIAGAIHAGYLHQETFPISGQV